MIVMDEQTQSISRRGLFRALFRPLSRARQLASDRKSLEKGPDLDDGQAKVAVIQDRFCLASQGGMCFTCSERCPEPGAITTQRGVPTVHADICTGCGLCHELCPAPVNAILLVADPSHADSDSR